MTPMMKLINALNALVAALQEIAGEETKIEMGQFVEIYTPPELEEPSAQPAETKASAEPEKVTLDAVKAVLVEKSRMGFKAEVKALVKKHGADKISALQESQYAAVLKEAEQIGK
ncbi:MAG: rRNA biogenesis protein rrp5 [Oscillospiraceae bacterium]|nr:rRNA biogenesis protein rrp5 [Oscillospiraceae bacterium]